MKIKSVAALAAAALALPAAAFAQDDLSLGKGTLLVTARVTSVSSSADDPIKTAAGANSGLNVDVSTDVMPTLGFTYFLTDNLAVEGILGATQHQIKATGTATNLDVYKTWVLPPVVTLQYRPIKGGTFSPYVGAGVNAMLFFSGKDQNGFKTKLDNGLGLALQAGFDAPVAPGWTINLDVKKVYFKTDASVNGGALTSNVHLDPWVASIGIGHRF